MSKYKYQHCPATTTTARRYGQFLDVPPLEERVMDDYTADILSAIARRQRNLETCTASYLPRDRDGISVYHRTRALENLGLLNIHSRRDATTAKEQFTLTADGWSAIGQPVPEWLERAA